MISTLMRVDDLRSVRRKKKRHFSLFYCKWDDYYKREMKKKNQNVLSSSIFSFSVFVDESGFLFCFIRT